MRVADASERAGVSAASISEATGIPVADLTSRLKAEEISVNDLWVLGGLFRVPAASLVGAVA